jgi:hypothetical protein
VDGEFVVARKGTLTWLSATGLQLRESQNHTDAWFVRSLSKSSYICADGYTAVSHKKENSTFWIKT